MPKPSSADPDRIPAYNDSGQRLHLNGEPAFTDQLGPKTKATTKAKTKKYPSVAPPPPVGNEREANSK